MNYYYAMVPIRDLLERLGGRSSQQQQDLEQKGRATSRSRIGKDHRKHVTHNTHNRLCANATGKQERERGHRQLVRLRNISLFRKESEKVIRQFIFDNYSILI